MSTISNGSGEPPRRGQRRRRPPGRPRPRLAAQRRVVVGPGARPHRCRLPRRHLRPPGFRRERQAGRGLGLRLRHAHRRPRRRAHRARPERRHPRRVLDGRRRGGPLPRHPRGRPGAQRGLRGRHPAVPGARRRPPRRRARRRDGARASRTGSWPTRGASSTASPATSSARTTSSGSARRSSRRRSASPCRPTCTPPASASARGPPTSPPTWRRSPCRPWSSTATPTPSCRSRSPGQRTHEQVAGSELHVVEGGPHGINTSHTEEFNRELLAFLQR